MQRVEQLAAEREGVGERERERERERKGGEGERGAREEGGREGERELSARERDSASIIVKRRSEKGAEEGRALKSVKLAATHLICGPGPTECGKSVCFLLLAVVRVFGSV